MTVSPSIPDTIEIRRSRLFGGALVVAAAAAGLTWALLAFAFDTSSESSVPRSNIGSIPAGLATPAGIVRQAEQYGRGLSNVGMLGAPASTSSAALDAQRVPSIMSLTPARLAAGALGTGYALPTVHRGPTVASVLASMSPQTRRYTKAVMALTFAQLAAGAAGHP
jgi:hypothetical protein